VRPTTSFFPIPSLIKKGTTRPSEATGRLRLLPPPTRRPPDASGLTQHGSSASPPPAWVAALRQAADGDRVHSISYELAFHPDDRCRREPFAFDPGRAAPRPVGGALVGHSEILYPKLAPTGGGGLLQLSSRPMPRMCSSVLLC